MPGAMPGMGKDLAFALSSAAAKAELLRQLSFQRSPCTVRLMRRILLFPIINPASQNLISRPSAFISG
jgi:hypothetical protein